MDHAGLFKEKVLRRALMFNPLLLYLTLMLCRHIESFSSRCSIPFPEITRCSFSHILFSSRVIYTVSYVKSKNVHYFLCCRELNSNNTGWHSGEKEVACSGTGTSSWLDTTQRLVGRGEHQVTNNLS